jgi:hypothetical protein
MANAGYQLSGNVVGAKEMQEAFSRAGAFIFDIFGPALTRTAIEFKQAAKDRAPVNTGQLKGSINHKEAYREGQNIVAEVGTNVIHAKSMEYGFKRWVPLAPLVRWAYLKLGNPGAARAIQRKLAFKGFEGKFFFKNAKIEIAPRWENTVREALSDLNRRLATA